MVVVDQSDSYLSREFTRRVNATPDVEVVGVCPDMAEAKKMLDEKKAYGILLFPPDYSKDLHEGRQTTVSLYCDMSALLFYKAFLLATTEVSLDMGKELRMHNNPSSTDKMDQITVDPIPYESVALFNSQNGFASFLVPAILILVLQQTLILGIGMLGGTAREKNRFHSLVPICRHFNGTLRIVFGKSLTYLLLYVVVCIWVLAIVPKLFSLPQVGEPLTILLFSLMFLPLFVKSYFRFRVVLQVFAIACDYAARLPFRCSAGCADRRLPARSACRDGGRRSCARATACRIVARIPRNAMPAPWNRRTTFPASIRSR